MLTLSQLRVITINYLLMHHPERLRRCAEVSRLPLIRWTESEDSCSLYIYMSFLDDKVVSFYDKTTRKGETTVTDFRRRCRGGNPIVSHYEYNF